MQKGESEVDVEALVDEAQSKASHNASLMKKALESGNLRESLKYADAMLGELRIPNITPKQYYVLCMRVN
jgi:vacuolar protein sorting-associated protein 35